MTKQSKMFTTSSETALVFLPVIFHFFKKKRKTRKETNRKKEPQKLKQARAHKKLLEVDGEAWEEASLVTSHEATALHAVACNSTSNSTTNTMSNGR